MTRKRGLGRGLDALLSVSAEHAAHAGDGSDELRLLAVDLIRRGQHQPRLGIAQEGLRELADSIKSQGFIQPIVVRPLDETGQYEIIAGERRWRAAQLAGIHQVPALIRDVSDRAAMSIALIENIQREQLNPMDEARGLSRLLKEFGMTHQQVADAIGRSRVAVTNLLRLLELTREVAELVETGRLEMGHARAIAALPGALQLAAATKVVQRDLSVRQTERLVRQMKAAEAPARKRAQHTADPDIRRLESDLAGKLAAQVAIRHSAAGRGTVTIHYHSLDELDGILRHIK